MLTALFKTLFPASTGLELSHLDVTDHQATIHLTSTHPSVHCPGCETISSSLHSRYERQVTDLPWSGIPVLLRLAVRRFRCREPTCRCRVLTERLPNVLHPFARRTNRFKHALEHVALTAGGELGHRLLKPLGCPTSPDALLTAARQAQSPVTSPPKIIGVDDFAFLRGRKYGTVIVNLETHKPIDLLPDRTSSTLATWLKAHPSVTTITRDRWSEYARGIAEGAPDAVQVLDRWHLLKNLREALERELNRHRKNISAALAEGAITSAGRITSKAEDIASLAALERRQALHAHIKERHADLGSIAKTARELSVTRTLVRKAVYADAPPERRRHARPPGLLTPFEAHLTQRWAEGCRNACLLFREIKAQGFSGKQRSVLRWAQERRELPAPSTPSAYRETAVRSKVTGLDAARTKVSFSSRQLSWLLLRDELELSVTERELVGRVRQGCPQVEVAGSLARSFAALVRERHADGFASWLTEVRASDLPDLKSFAVGLEREGQALLNALSLPFSNGPVEGAVNRIKLFKRQMYGRSSLELLKKRVLLAA